MRLVESHLLGATAFRFGDGPLHAVGDAVCVQNGLAVHVARRPPDRLNQAALAAQKAFLVRVQNRYQRHFRNVQTLAQQVDAHQHIEAAQTQVTDDFHALHCVDVAVQVAHLHAVFRQVIRQLLGHALGQRGDQHAVALLRAVADFLQHIVHLAGGRAHFHFRINQAGGTHHLLHHLAGMGLFIIRWRSRDEYHLPHLALELLEL